MMRLCELDAVHDIFPCGIQLFQGNFIFEKTKDNATKKEIRPTLICYTLNILLQKGHSRSQHNILICMLP